MKQSTSIIHYLILILVIAGLITNISNCPILTCANDNEGNDGVCFDYDNVQKEIKIFPQSCQNCQFQLSEIVQSNGDINKKGIDSYNNCSSSPVSFKRYNGEACEQNQDCISSRCEEQICKGQQLSEECNDEQQQFCDSGLSCINKKCQKVKQKNESCQSTFECDNQTFCHNNKCVPYGSLTDGLKVEDNFSRVEVKCSSFLTDENGTCINSNENITVSTCSAQKKCSADEIFTCSLFSNQYTYSQKGGLSEKVKAQIYKVILQLLALNQFCPTSLKFSQSCHLISDQVAQLNEINSIYQNFGKLLNMPFCIKNQLKYQNIYEIFLTDFKQIEGQVLDDITEVSSSESSFSFVFIIAVVVLLIFTAVAAGYFYLKKRSIYKLEDPQIISEVQETNNKRNNSNSKKDKNINSSAQNKEALNLEYNPTSAKGDNQIDISNSQGIQDPKKNGHLETSVNQNFFSIDGEDEKEAKVVDSYDDSQSESDNGVSYENVFNIEGENIDKPNSQRKKRRQTNRKKIVKKDSEKKYEVVEE